LEGVEDQSFMNKLKEDNKHFFTTEMCQDILHAIPKQAMVSTFEDVKRIDLLKWLHKEQDFS
jgi:hypothetical protein